VLYTHGVVELRPRRAKIVATLGPATASEERIEGVLRAGVDVVRLNFSHGTQAEHGERIARVRAAAGRLGRAVAVLQDLQGPKIRTGRLEGGGPVTLVTGAQLVITTRDALGNPNLISTTYERLPADVKPGDTLLLDDGRLRLSVVSSGDDEVLARVEHGGPLGEHKGINLSGVAVSAPALTDKDRADLEFGLGQGVDFVALSFVRTAAEVEVARQLVESHGRKVPLITKLEKPQAIENLDAILDASDGVMVARGDLGVELPAEEVPMIQKTIIRKANHLGKPVITATQMLESMVSQPSPTRAEATDVANAVWDGTDAVMLSAESAVGQYPIEAVQMMDRIVTEAEKHLTRPDPRAGRVSHAHAVARAARSLAEDLDVKAIVCFTRSGRTARLLSRDRPRVPILAFTSDRLLERRLALWWGVTPLHRSPLTGARAALSDSTDELLDYMERALLEHGMVHEGDRVVVVGAIPFRADVHTNFLKLHQVN
jgi:pyruvate kinase